VLKEWRDIFKNEFEKKYFKLLIEKIKYEYSKYRCEPKPENIFRVFNECCPEDILVVIIGRDPNPAGHATGVAFGCEENGITTISLESIFEEVEQEYGEVPRDKTLMSWMYQGVFLLNSFLTTKYGFSRSHPEWEEFTDFVVKYINDNFDPVIFVLLGDIAQRKHRLITQPNRILFSSNPFPMSDGRSFQNSKIFLEVNSIIREMGEEEIDWVSIIE